MVRIKSRVEPPELKVVVVKRAEGKIFTTFQTLPEGTVSVWLTNLAWEKLRLWLCNPLWKSKAPRNSKTGNIRIAQI